MHQIVRKYVFPTSLMLHEKLALRERRNKTLWRLSLELGQAHLVDMSILSLIAYLLSYRAQIRIKVVVTCRKGSIWASTQILPLLTLQTLRIELNGILRINLRERSLQRSVKVAYACVQIVLMRSLRNALTSVHSLTVTFLLGIVRKFVYCWRVVSDH